MINNFCFRFPTCKIFLASRKHLKPWWRDSCAYQRGETLLRRIDLFCVDNLHLHWCFFKRSLRLRRSDRFAQKSFFSPVSIKQLLIFASSADVTLAPLSHDETQQSLTKTWITKHFMYHIGLCRTHIYFIVLHTGFLGIIFKVKTMSLALTPFSGSHMLMAQWNILLAELDIPECYFPRTSRAQNGGRGVIFLDGNEIKFSKWRCSEWLPIMIPATYNGTYTAKTRQTEKEPWYKILA